MKRRFTLFAPLVVGLTFTASIMFNSCAFDLTDLDELISAIRELRPAPASVLNTGRAILYALNEMRLKGRAESVWSLYIITDGRAKVGG